MKIAAVLNAYKRPNAIDKQIEALKIQTRPPDAIIINNNNSGYSFNDEGIDTYEIQNGSNLGVYARFYILNNFTQFTHFLVIDDDMIPQQSFIEAQIRAFEQKKGLYVGSGIQLTKRGYNSHIKKGWNGEPVTKTTEVDMGGHTWWFPRSYLIAFNRPTLSKNRMNGEDIHFSYMLKKYGIKTLVAPTVGGELPTHPQEGMDLGTDENATWKKEGHFQFRNKLIKAYIDKLEKESIPKLEKEKKMKIATPENSCSWSQIEGQPKVYHPGNTLTSDKPFWKQPTSQYEDRFETMVPHEPKFTSHFNHIINKLNNRENFILSRFGDGEFGIMNGDIIGNSEWQYSGEMVVHKRFRKALQNAWQQLTSDTNALVGIPCKCCAPNLRNQIGDLNRYRAMITFNNIFVNANYRRFEEFLDACEKQADRVMVVGSRDGAFTDKMKWKNFKYYAMVPKQVIEMEPLEWRIINDLKQKMTDDTIMLIAAGPASEIIIAGMQMDNPNLGTIIDVGSAINPYIGMPNNRGYLMNNNNINKECIL